MKIRLLINSFFLLAAFSCQKEKFPDNLSIPALSGKWNWEKSTPAFRETQTWNFFNNSFCHPIFLKSNGQYARFCKIEDKVSDMTFHPNDFWRLESVKLIFNSGSKITEMEIESFDKERLILLERIDNWQFRHELKRP